MTAPLALLDQLAALHEDAFSWAAACCGGDGDAGADALQEAYVKVASGRAIFGEKSSLKTWWLAVVRLTALERRRGQKRWQRMADSFLDWVSVVSPAAPEETGEIASATSPEQLSAALSLLPARQAEVLHLVFQHDLSLSEAAVVMSVSVGSVRQHYDRAKKRLRSVLCAEMQPAFTDHVR